MKPSPLNKRFFAWLLQKGDRANRRIYRPYKADLFQNLTGTIVEIGPGAGGNFEYMNEGTEWTGLEPNASFHSFLLKRAEEKKIHAKILSTESEQFPLPDNYADIIICTLVLCSVKDPLRIISEVRRVLKPGGKYYFIEHVAAPQGTFLRSMQNFSNPINRIIADGCNCNRETWNAIHHAGFSHVKLSHARMGGSMLIHSPHVFGYAVK